MGGAVRDALLGVNSASPDLDFVVWGTDVQTLATALGLPFVWHPVYGNATLSLPEGSHVDLVSARRETYAAAGASPQPLPGTLPDDLARRDFSVNTLALELLPDEEKRLLGVPNALDDLRNRTLRPLHALSFRDDASRLVRGARLAARLGLHAHPELLAQVPAALEVADTTPRLSAELKLLLHELHAGRAARTLSEWGAGTLLPEQATPLLERLDAQTDPDPLLAAALVLSAAPQPDTLATRLNLGERPAALLARAHSERPFPAHSQEHRLRDLLNLTPPYVPLQGRDLLSLGLGAGPELGRVLAWLADQRRAGRFASRQDELNAVREHLRTGD
ncbi:CCA tRNA nucleotidyltransferase [Deinococcus sp. KNUC1210]|uniref:CCA tRNA nucleotidyltransferase n=1 Tax=Deinococcus sp. KNUC1210 TaxID=2917691 RepID=UPI001EF0132A|nr:CCA tRNA nucleotidyltransferase [Deinococcus sp. KNUC1210]ULH16155.1 CCA tRNA nucleotidyltransferase [Deinococcus sp. KNUC1210]